MILSLGLPDFRPLILAPLSLRKNDAWFCPVLNIPFLPVLLICKTEIIQLMDVVWGL